MELQHQNSPTHVVMRAAVGSVNSTGRPTLTWGEPFLAAIRWSPKQRQQAPRPFVGMVVHGRGPAFDMGDFDPMWDLYSREHEGRYFAMQAIAVARPGLSPADAITNAMANPDPTTKMNFAALGQANDQKRRAELTAMSQRSSAIFRGM